MDIKLFVATKAFIVKDGKVLILRESQKYEDGTNAAHFDLPGGRLAPGEHFAEALAREMKEETGLSVTLGRPITVGEWRPVVRGEHWHIVGIFFECSATEGEVALSGDHDGFEWIDPKEYEHYPIIANLKSVFEAYIEMYLEKGAR